MLLHGYTDDLIEAGADVLCIADHATGDLVGPWTYRDFLLPYHKELTQRLGCPTVLHICGNTLDRMDHICQAGFDCFHFDSKVDARDAGDEPAWLATVLPGVGVAVSGRRELAASTLESRIAITVIHGGMANIR